MDAANCSLAAGLVSASYVNQGAAALAARRKLVKALLSNRTLPAEGWDEATIEMLLQVNKCICGLCLRVWLDGGVGLEQDAAGRGLGRDDHTDAAAGEALAAG